MIAQVLNLPKSPDDCFLLANDPARLSTSPYTVESKVYRIIYPEIREYRDLLNAENAIFSTAGFYSGVRDQKTDVCIQGYLRIL